MSGPLIRIPPEDALTQPTWLRRLRIFRFWAISIIYVLALLVALVCLALCGLSIYFAKSTGDWSTVGALFGVGGSSGGLGAFLITADRRILTEMDQLAAMDRLESELKRTPDDSKLRQRVLDLQFRRASGQINASKTKTPK